MGISLILLALLFLLLCRRMKSGRSSFPKPSAGKGCYLCAIVACAYPVLQPNALETFGVRTDVWDQSGSYSKDGALAVFLRNTQFMSVEPPQDPSAQTSSGLRSRSLLSNRLFPPIPVRTSSPS